MDLDEKENVIEQILSVKAGSKHLEGEELDVDNEVQKLMEMSDEELVKVWDGWYYEWASSRSDFEGEEPDELLENIKNGEVPYGFSHYELVQVELDSYDF